MLFNSLLFVAFFVPFFCIYHFVTRTREQKLWTITLGSLLFYAGWDYRFVPLLLCTALVDFYIARGISRLPLKDPWRKRLLTFSVVVNLGVLAFFKYTNFFLGSLFGLFSQLGLDVHFHALAIVLPAGISFYTFQSMSYTIDVYRRVLVARERPIEFVSAVTFFPHLVAGPIIRASTLLPQFERMDPPPWAAFQRGFLLISIGLFNKTIGDLLGGTADDLFSDPGPHGALQAWTGALAFTGQVYGDFAGYTGIAIGVALLLGFYVPPNFNLPFIAQSMVEHWTRWHMSLSAWFRDYLFAPLALRYRRSPYLVTIASMTLIGLWHGANWNYIVFGVVQGVLLAATGYLQPRLEPFAERLPALPVKLVNILFTFFLVVNAFTLFRAPSLPQALSILRDLYVPRAHSVANEKTGLLLGLVLGGIVIGHLASAIEAGTEDPAILRRPVLLWTVVAIGLLVALLFGTSLRPFIYFQF